jgi:adenosylhomocysteine nucleosidase
MDVLIIFALAFELEPTVARLKLGDDPRAAALYTGAVSGRRVGAATTGVGRPRADAACRSLVERLRPDLILFSGFAGGLVADLEVGDVVCPEQVVLGEGERFDEERPGGRIPSFEIPASAELARGVRGAARSAGARLETGALVTVDRAVREPGHKRALGDATAAVAVDMESAASVACASELATPCAVVRAISDAVDDEIPEGLGGLIGPDGALVPSELARVSSRPELLEALRGLTSAGQRAALNLASVFEAYLAG